jgi:2-keto-4-pentenoate hydratase
MRGANGGARFGGVATAARYYRDAFAARDRLAPPGSCRPRSLDDAYAVQQAVVALHEAEGRGTVGGYKIALTTSVMQRLMGFDQPCLGAMFAPEIRQSPARIDMASFGRIGVECEIAVRIGRDLDAGPYDRVSVADGVSACMAAIEVIDDQNADYDDTDAFSLIAANAWNAGSVLSTPLEDWRSCDLRSIVGRLRIDGTEVASGRGEDVMGHPFEALAFVADTLWRQGRPLRAGMVVMTGSVVATRWPGPGETITAEFDGIGGASVRFD